MKILSLAPYVPHSQISHAGGVFLNHYLQELVARGDDVTLVAPATLSNREAMTRELPPGVVVQLVPTPRSMEQTWVRAPLYPFEALSAPSPGVLTRNAYRRSAALRTLVAAADVVEIQWSQFLPFAADVRRWRSAVPISAILHDLYGDSLAQLAAEAKSLRIRTVAQLTHTRAARRELALVRECDVAFSFNERERSLVENATDTPTHLIDPWIDWPTTPRPPSETPSVLFVADLRRHENHEAASWLATDVWPRVTRREPRARLVLAGSEPPASITELASESVVVTGFVPTLEPYYEAARVFAAPLRTGAGLKFKVAQALACGLPVVATSVAADGFEERGGAEVFGAIADDPEGFADALVRFLADRPLAMRTGRAASAWARSAFSFDASIDRVREAYAASIELSR